MSPENSVCPAQEHRGPPIVRTFVVSVLCAELLGLEAHGAGVVGNVVVGATTHERDVAGGELERRVRIVEP